MSPDRVCSVTVVCCLFCPALPARIFLMEQMEPDSFLSGSPACCAPSPSVLLPVIRVMSVWSVCVVCRSLSLCAMRSACPLSVPMADNCRHDFPLRVYISTYHNFCQALFKKIFLPGADFLPCKGSVSEEKQETFPRVSACWMSFQQTDIFKKISGCFFLQTIRTARMPATARSSGAADSGCRCRTAGLSCATDRQRSAIRRFFQQASCSACIFAGPDTLPVTRPPKRQTMPGPARGSGQNPRGFAYDRIWFCPAAREKKLHAARVRLQQEGPGSLT